MLSNQFCSLLRSFHVVWQCKINIFKVSNQPTSQHRTLPERTRHYTARRNTDATYQTAVDASLASKT